MYDIVFNHQQLYTKDKMITNVVTDIKQENIYISYGLKRLHKAYPKYISSQCTLENMHKCILQNINGEQDKVYNGPPVIDFMKNNQGYRRKY